MYGKYYSVYEVSDPDEPCVLSAETLQEIADYFGKGVRPNRIAEHLSPSRAGRLLTFGTKRYKVYKFEDENGGDDDSSDGGNLRAKQARHVRRDDDGRLYPKRQKRDKTFERADANTLALFIDTFGEDGFRITSDGKVNIRMEIRLGNLAAGAPSANWRYFARTVANAAELCRVYKVSAA